MSVFCLGRRGKIFTLESVDWDSGKSLWYKALGHSLAWNSQYAGTEIGTHDDIIMGTLTGILRVTTKEDKTSSKKTEREDPRWVVLQNIQETVDKCIISVNMGYRSVLELLTITKN